MKQYLIITTDNNPFYTDYFDYENLYNSDIMICIFDLYRYKHTLNGKDWIETEVDHL